MSPLSNLLEIPTKYKCDCPDKTNRIEEEEDVFESEQDEKDDFSFKLIVDDMFKGSERLNLSSRRLLTSFK